MSAKACLASSSSLSSRTSLDDRSIGLPVRIDTDRLSWVNASESADINRVGTRAFRAYVRTKADLPVPGPAHTRHSCPLRNLVPFFSRESIPLVRDPPRDL